jgi:hypothetical protein
MTSSGAFSRAGGLADAPVADRPVDGAAVGDCPVDGGAVGVCPVDCVPAAATSTANPIVQRRQLRFVDRFMSPSFGLRAPGMQL